MDGAIVAALAKGDQVFNLYEFPLDESRAARQLTHTSSGATWPDVSSDGRTIVFVGYTTSGYDLFSMPYPVAPAPARTLVAPAAESSATPVSMPVSSPSTSYSPLGTLRPTSWSPEIEADSDQVRLGAAVFGSDVLGYHCVRGVGNVVGRVAGRCANTRRRVARLVRLVRLQSMAAGAIRHGVARDVVLRWTRNRPRDAVGRNSP